MTLAYIDEETAGETIVIPDDFLDVLDPPAPGLDHRLGYTHDGHYVCFWADRNGQVAWADGIERGISTKASSAFHHEIEPLAADYNLSVWEKSPQQYALVLDRHEGWAYLAPLATALAFVGAK